MSNRKLLIDEKLITRVTVIDHTRGGQGRELEKWNVSLSVSVQDDGKTLKLFLGDRA